MSMTPEKIAVGKKLVWARKPYVPREDLMGEFIGRERELQMLAAAWIGGPRSQPLSPLLVGPPGCGKGRLAIELAKRMGLDLYVCQGFENIGADELACTLVPADAGNGQIEYVLSALATAMVVGGVAFLDELSRYPGQALSLLASVLDDRRYLDLDLIGERIHAHPNFRFIAASNVEDVQGLPEFLRSRLFPTLMLEQPAPEVISTIVQRQFPAQQQLIGELLTGFWRLWDRSTVDPEPPSPRAVLQIFSLA